MVYLPLLVKGEAIGSLVIGSCHLNAYSPEQVNLLEGLVSQIAVSVDNSRLYFKAEQRARIDELTGLFNRRHFDESLRREIDRHARHGGMMSLAFIDLDLFKEFNDKEGHPAGDKVLARIGRIIEKSFRSVDMAFRYGGDEFAVVLPQSDSSSAFVVAERVRTQLSRDMKEENTGITASIGHACWPGDGVTADDIVTAADRALYYAKRTGGNRTSVVSKMLPQSIEEKLPGPKAEKEALSVIYALASTIEARDEYTYGHSRDVSRYAVLLGEALGFPSEKVAAVSTAALLHDIGKIGIPDEVLNKPGQLDGEEWELIRSHPKLSATIVGHVPSLTPCLAAILHHHERWDGLGYPSGLQGEAIPLEARVLSIADAFEAMTSPRPYRERMATSDALEELRRSANSEFDPRLIDIFIQIVSAANEIVPEKNTVGKKPNRRR
jgi:diguanylate cyclase (GGDEF)-like protein